SAIAFQDTPERNCAWRTSCAACSLVIMMGLLPNAGQRYPGHPRIRSAGRAGTARTVGIGRGTAPNAKCPPDASASGGHFAVTGASAEGDLVVGGHALVDRAGGLDLHRRQVLG